jgi:hypothetical protein
MPPEIQAVNVTRTGEGRALVAQPSGVRNLPPDFSPLTEDDRYRAVREVMLYSHRIFLTVRIVLKGGPAFHPFMQRTAKNVAAGHGDLDLGGTASASWVVVGQGQSRLQTLSLFELRANHSLLKSLAKIDDIVVRGRFRGWSGRVIVEPGSRVIEATQTMTSLAFDGHQV